MLRGCPVGAGLDRPDLLGDPDALLGENGREAVLIDRTSVEQGLLDVVAEVNRELVEILDLLALLPVQLVGLLGHPVDRVLGLELAGHHRQSVPTHDPVVAAPKVLVAGEPQCAFQARVPVDDRDVRVQFSSVTLGLFLLRTLRVGMNGRRYRQGVRPPLPRCLVSQVGGSLLLRRVLRVGEIFERERVLVDDRLVDETLVGLLAGPGQCDELLGAAIAPVRGDARISLAFVLPVFRRVLGAERDVVHHARDIRDAQGHGDDAHV